MNSSLTFCKTTVIWSTLNNLVFSLLHREALKRANYLEGEGSPFHAVEVELYKKYGWRNWYEEESRPNLRHSVITFREFSRRVADLPGRVKCTILISSRGSYLDPIISTERSRSFLNESYLEDIVRSWILRLGDVWKLKDTSEMDIEHRLFFDERTSKKGKLLRLYCYVAPWKIRETGYIYIRFQVIIEWKSIQ